MEFNMYKTILVLLDGSKRAEVISVTGEMFFTT